MWQDQNGSSSIRPPQLQPQSNPILNQMMNQPLLHLWQQPDMTSHLTPLSASARPVLSTMLIKANNKKIRFQCSNCPKSYSDKKGLMVHHKSIHLGEMYKCTVPGCDIMFTTRQSRSRHSKNVRLHSFYDTLKADMWQDEEHQLSKSFEPVKQNDSSFSGGKIGEVIKNENVVQQQQQPHQFSNGGYLKEKTIVRDEKDDVEVLFTKPKQTNAAPELLQVNLWDSKSAVLFTALTSAVAASVPLNNELAQ